MAPPCLLPTTFLISRQNMFCPLLQLCWRENIRDNKKDITFLLVWDKDSNTEGFLGLLPCTCVLQPKLVRLYLISSLLPGHLPIVTSVSLRSLYLLLYGGHIKHFQVLGFIPFPYSSCLHSPISLWPMPNNIIAFNNRIFVSLKSHPCSHMVLHQATFLSISFSVLYSVSHLSIIHLSSLTFQQTNI
jgi:hypothetical protein